MQDRTRPPTYPAIGFLVDYGMAVAVLVALVPACLGAWALAAGYGWICLVLGVAAGLVVGLVMCSYVEVLRIMSETLMPR